jgi:hypothetical protein
MFGGKTTIQLQIPEAHAVGRGPLVGAVILQTESSLDAKSIQVSFYGEAEIEYEYTKVEEDEEGKKTSKTEKYKKEKKFEKTKLSIAGPQKLQPGQYTFPFELNLSAGLQPSFKYKEKKTEAEIKYRMHAKVLKGALKSDTKSEKMAIKILPAVPAPKPAEKSDTNKFMFGKGTSTVSVKLPDTTFAHGQPMVVNVECHNDSKKDNKVIKAKLEQKIKLKSGEKDVPDWHRSKIVSEAKAEGVGKKRDKVVRELQIATSGIPPTVDHPFIEIEYKLKASADYSWARDPDVKIDVSLIPMLAPKQPQQQAQQPAEQQQAQTAGGNYTWGSEQGQAPAAKPMLKAGGSQPQLAPLQQPQAVTA